MFFKDIFRFFYIIQDYTIFCLMIVVAVRVSPALELLLVIKFYVLCRLVSSYCLKYFPIALDVGNSPDRCKTSFVIMAVDIRYLGDGCKLEDSARGISARINSQGYWCSFRRAVLLPALYGWFGDAWC